MSASEDVILINSDTEDELNLPAQDNNKRASLKRPMPDEIVPDSEGEQEAFLSLSRIPPPPQMRQPPTPNQQQDDVHSSSLSPPPNKPKKKKKTDSNDDVQVAPKAKKLKAAKAVILSQENSTSNNEESQSSSQLPPRPSKARARPRPKPKPKPKLQDQPETKMQSEGDSKTSCNVLGHTLEPLETFELPPPESIPHPSQERQKTPDLSPESQEQPLHSREEHQNSKLQSAKPSDPIPRSKSRGKEKQREKENPPSTPHPSTSKDTFIPPTPTNTFRTTSKKNRPLTDILRELNTAGTPRFSPAVSRNFLSRIAPLHPNRREPPPPPPRVIPKKTKKELQMEERWEEELQDSIPNWCELTEEERTQYRKQKRDWELGLYEE